LIALYRPGADGTDSEYVKPKKAITPIKYLHPLLRRICADTYGVMIYQEQVMAAASKLAGYSLAASRSLASRDGQEGQENDGEGPHNFIEKVARARQDSRKESERIFDLLEKFAGYGFTRATAQLTE